MFFYQIINQTRLLNVSKPRQFRSEPWFLWDSVSPPALETAVSFRNGNWTLWNHICGQTGAPQKPVPELQELKHFPGGAAEGWRAAVSGEALHEEELPHITGIHPHSISLGPRDFIITNILWDFHVFSLFKKNSN